MMRPWAVRDVTSWHDVTSYVPLLDVPPVLGPRPRVPQSVDGAASAAVLVGRSARRQSGRRRPSQSVPLAARRRHVAVGSVRVEPIGALVATAVLVDGERGEQQDEDDADGGPSNQADVEGKPTAGGGRRRHGGGTVAPAAAVGRAAGHRLAVVRVGTGALAGDTARRRRHPDGGCGRRRRRPGTGDRVGRRQRRRGRGSGTVDTGVVVQQQKVASCAGRFTVAVFVVVTVTTRLHSPTVVFQPANTTNGQLEHCVLYRAKDPFDMTFTSDLQEAHHLINISNDFERPLHD